MTITETPRRTSHRGVFRVPALAAPILIGLLGFTIAVTGITIPAVWYDEAATITSATRTWPQLWAMLGNVDAVHGLYYFLMHVVFDVFGYSPLTLRMPSAIAVGATAALVVVVGRQLGRSRIGWIAGLVFCIIPRTTWAGTEGRSYALTALFAVLMTVVLLYSLRGSRRRWILYGLVVLVSVTLFIYLALVVVAHGITMTWLAVRRGGRHDLIAWGVTAGAAAVVSLPVVLASIAQSGQVAWIDPVGPATIRQVLRSQWFYGGDLFAILAWALIIFGVVATARHNRRQLALILPALVVPTALLVLISVVHTPLYQPRYLTMCLPFVALAIAVGVNAIRWRPAGYGALALLLALALPQIVQQRTAEAKENSSWSQVADLIASERALDGPGVETAIVYGNLQRHPSATARVMAYSYPDAFAGTIDPTLITPAAETAELWETRAPLALSLSRLADADVTYLITSNARDLRPETTVAMQSAGWRVAQSWDFTAVHVIRYERD